MIVSIWFTSGVLGESFDFFQNVFNFIINFNRGYGRAYRKHIDDRLESFARLFPDRRQEGTYNIDPVRFLAPCLPAYLRAAADNNIGNDGPVRDNAAEDEHVADAIALPFIAPADLFDDAALALHEIE